MNLKICSYVPYSVCRLDTCTSLRIMESMNYNISVKVILAMQ